MTDAILRPLRRAKRALHVGCLFAALALCAGSPVSLAHEGHDHGQEAPSGAAPASPRVVATSETYQLVGIVEGEVLVIYLDRAQDNAPVTDAKLEVSLDGQSFSAEPLKSSGTYEVTAPLLRKPGDVEVLVSLSEGDITDLLVGTLKLPGPPEAATPRAWRQVAQNLREALPGGRAAVGLAGVLLLAAVAGGLLLSGRRKHFLLPAAIVCLVLASALAWAHEGHDHGPDMRASAGNSPARRPDGTLFVPKPTQRLLEIRTRTATVGSHERTARFNGRVVANPNRSGVVQSTLQGRYEPPEGGMPALGSRVKAGDLLGRVAPAFQSIDSSDMAQTLGTLDQEISLHRRRLERQEQLLARNVVARATVEDIRIQLEGLEKRRRELLAAKVRPDDLRAPVDGVIASTHVVAGQVVAPSDRLFQIIDPASLLVEALVFDQVDPDAVEKATAAASGRGTMKLAYLGRSRALEQQYTILQFRIVEAPAALDAGTPVTVLATTGEKVSGVVLPRAALAQAPNGQTVVFIHREPEVFVPRPVRFEDFDGERVLVTGGIEAGEKIVVRNAPLLNQVR